VEPLFRLTKKKTRLTILLEAQSTITAIISHKRKGKAMLKSYKSLSPKTRLALGAGIIAWGAAGLYLSDQAEEKFGFTPTEEDKEVLRKYTPRITTVNKPEAAGQSSK
jgi:hypothetical protein